MQECWDFLLARREKTVILLTTHYMDEADCLGDRVMVMSAGRAKCCGSGQFLKAAFSCGYQIRCLLPPEDYSDVAKELVVSTIERFLGGRVSGKAGSGQELNVTVRMDQAGSFATMFPELDNLVKAQKLKEWSISVCSLEEVLGSQFKSVGNIQRIFFTPPLIPKFPTARFRMDSRPGL